MDRGKELNRFESVIIVVVVVVDGGVTGTLTIRSMFFLLWYLFMLVW